MWARFVGSCTVSECCSGTALPTFHTLLPYCSCCHLCLTHPCRFEFLEAIVRLGELSVT